jgi:DNA-binding CsgD family transcriptional regulator
MALEAAITAKTAFRKEIASDLGIAVSTVRTHLERFYRENGLRNKSEAVAAWQHYRDTKQPANDSEH